MLEIEIPGWRHLQLRYLVMDLNGTLALDGQPLPGVADALRELRSTLQLILVTADTFGTAEDVAKDLGVELNRLPSGDQSEQKRQIVRRLGPEHVVAMGNGANDVGMLMEAALAIVVLGPEGAARAALQHGDVIVSSPLTGLDLLRHPSRLKATLRRS
ncbi:MAG: HAD family hydrolase [Anaerolineae bacterium]